MTIGGNLLELCRVFTAPFLQNSPQGFANVQANVTAKVNAVHFPASSSNQVRNSIADNTGIEVAGMQHFERVRVGIFGNNGLTAECLRLIARCGLGGSCQTAVGKRYVNKAGASDSYLFDFIAERFAQFGDQ